MQALWYASRSSGLVALLLLTGTMLLGITGVVRFAAPGWPRFVLAQLHRNLSLITLAFLAVHVSTAVIDPYAGIRWIDTVVPFASSYRTFWLGLGVVAIELLIALVVSSLLRTRIGLRTWRAAHWASYACWPVAVVHGLGIGGQDIRTPWVLGLTVGCVVLVAGGLFWRVLAAPAAEAGRAEVIRR
ncbi:ferric reductase-like transmembrane domain-containing protein [Pseudonocardia acidicola]|nr:ferric reductase-like transmembrane domain-containing protein [Pseudonocardia acidicola]